ncbi:MAG: DPP IV N-terminal domain-containing protein [Gemmatimonadaceae bacterium]
MIPVVRHLGRAALAAAFAVPVAAAQGNQPYAPKQVTAADYQRAERALAQNTLPLVSGAFVQPVWLPNDRFWYRMASGQDGQFILVDPTKRTRAAAFDAAKIARAMTAAGAQLEGGRVPFTRFDFSAGDKSIAFDVRGRHWTCDVEGTKCEATGQEDPAMRANPALANRGGPVRRRENVSPDGKRAAFIRDFNLWMRDVATGTETRLTADGVKDFGYATDNAGWIHGDDAVLIWSPDSKKIATFQQDERGVGMMYLVRTEIGHPELEAWHYPLPGDSVITMIQRVIIDVDAAGGPKVVRLQMPPDQHRSTLCDHVVCRGAGEWADVEWYPDGSHLAFVSTSRDHKREWLRVADASTGAIRDVYEETSPTQFESGLFAVNWHVLPATNEFLWFSERSDWAQIYLYDLSTGKVKNQVTTGDGAVLQVLRVDAKARSIMFIATGKEQGRDPYFRHLYSASLDGKRQALLTPENADHELSLSPSGRYVVDSYSTPTTPQTTVVRDAAGKPLLTIEKADISRLVAAGWQAPIPITMKARDGKTDIYGIMYRPSVFDSTKKYPIINQIYPGPQAGSVGGRGFSPSRGDTQALADLGFVVVQIDAMGTPMRSKSFHDAYYGNMGDNGLPDQIAGMKELASRYAWIDIDRAGIWGHSGGGFATADAMFRYPDFFKVGISESGNHDNRQYEDDWGERYQGLLTRGPNASTNYDDQANQNLAKNLKGKLLIAHGAMDDNVPPYNTYLVVDQLVKANKDFDLLILPNQRHGYGAQSDYMMRRRWDYFVKNLLGAEPPANYEMRKMRQVP